MNLQTYIVDAFTKEKFKGNPAGVCLVDSLKNETLMQNIAAELNLSETAFLKKLEDKIYQVRYFTPLAEIDFCGHATLGASKVLMEAFDLDQVTLHTWTGLQLETSKHTEGILMKFPIYDTESIQPSDELLKAIGIEQFDFAGKSLDSGFLMIEINDYALLKSLSPDFQSLKLSKDTDLGVIVTSKGDQEYDFYSRMFAPWVGIDEDPVTGSAHAVLAKYWSLKLGKSILKAFQASKRGGEMTLEIEEDYLWVLSDAQIVFEGQFKY